MATMRVIMLVLLVSEVVITMVATTASKPAVIDVFQKGYFETTTIWVAKGRHHPAAPPEGVFVVSPNQVGTYPVLFFIHGTWLEGSYYSDLFTHVASHGFIIVAPQLCSMTYLPSALEEVEMAASVANWLPSNLNTILPTKVRGDLTKLALSGHSRGGKTAFALALGYSDTKLKVNFTSLIGIDPVDGSSKRVRPEPRILTYVPNSFDLSIPLTVVGTGLGSQWKSWSVRKACAPKGVNHEEFYNECKECSHFVIKEYGHADMLDTEAMETVQGSAIRAMCKNGRGARSLMRRTLSGIIVAFLDAYVIGDPVEYVSLLVDPSKAPAKLHPVAYKGTNDHHAQYKAQA